METQVVIAALGLMVLALLGGLWVGVRWLGPWLQLRRWERGLLKDHEEILVALGRRQGFREPHWYRLEVFRRQDGALYQYAVKLGAGSPHFQWVMTQADAGVCFIDCRKVDPHSRQDWMMVLDQIAASGAEAREAPDALPLPPTNAPELRKLLPNAFQTQVVQDVARTAFFNEKQAATMMLDGKASAQALAALRLPGPPRATGQWTDGGGNKG